MRGLPGSGKSRWAKQWVSENPTKRIRINKDDLRLMMHNGYYSKGNESSILKLEESIILDAINSKKSIVIDNTHLIDKHYNRIKKLIPNNEYQIKYKDLSDVPPETCIKRDLQREKSVGQNVIWKMYWENVAKIDKQINDPKNLKAIIVDVDGTIAEKGNRSPFDWDKVIHDKPKNHIINMVNMYHKNGYIIVVMSGRDGICENLTAAWLEEHNVLYNYLFMREPGDSRKDYIIKRSLYEENVKPYFNVELVLDDRPQVIRHCWRKLGIPVVNCNPIDLDF